MGVVVGLPAAALGCLFPLKNAGAAYRFFSLAFLEGLWKFDAMNREKKKKKQHSGIC